MLPLPSSEQQLSFLDKVQRLFDEGEFVATYKYALFLALIELAIERGEDSGESLDLPYTAIADKFLELYWPQVVPYSGGSQSGLLVQNKGRQAATVTLLHDLRNRYISLPKARASTDWHSAIQSTVALLKEMPLWRLQVLRRQHVDFLYIQGPGASIRLLPGVMYNLRRFHGLLQNLARSGWLAHIRSNPKNSAILGDAYDLEQVMFGTDRAALSAAREVLRDCQSDTCFYCQQPLRKSGEVDHFVPWSRYSRDLAHNFVLAHRACNGDKRDLLAAAVHLERWRGRNQRDSRALVDGLSAHFICDESTMLRVARWAYHQAYKTSSQTWLAPKQTVSLTSDYLALLES